jgi:hypothetical protein
MSLQKFKKAELEDKAVEIGLDVPEGATKKELEAFLDDAGVVEEDFAVEEEAAVEPAADESEETESAPVVEEEPDEQVKREDVLVKMDRQNVYYGTRWGEFSRQHPFKVLSWEDAKALMDNETGFRLANPSEAEEYYG